MVENSQSKQAQHADQTQQFPEALATGLTALRWRTPLTQQGGVTTFRVLKARTTKQSPELNTAGTETREAGGGGS